MSTEDLYSARHFSQTNPTGPGQGDVPALLRRVADTLETLGPVEVLDVVHHSEVTADGDWPSFTVYYVPFGRLTPPRPRPAH